MERLVNQSANRFQRQSGLVPQPPLAELKLTMIGVGAIGRQLAIQLAAIGARQLQLIDFDSVELTNTTTQGYRHDEIGELKVTATQREITRIDPAIEVSVLPYPFRPQYMVGQAVFCCVDSIGSRAAIWRSVRNRCKFWCDGRMLGEVIRVLAIAEPQQDRFYDTSLFDQSESQAGSCTSRSTVYTAAVAAALMVHQFTRWLRELPIDADLSLNLLASELVVSDPVSR